MALNIIQNYLTKNRCYQRNVKRTPIGIQMHTIGTGQGTAASVAEYWNQNIVSACVTYCVDCDTEGKVLQFLPESTRSWADAGYGNNNLITIEICESDYITYTSGASYKITNDAKFKEDILRGYNTAVLLCADICRRYGWNPTAKLANGLYLISSHDEGRRAGVSSAHVDPTHIWPKIGKTMDTFRADVKATMGTSASQTVNIKGVAIGDSNVEAISKVVYGEAGIIRSRESLLAVAQCIKDMLEVGGYGSTIAQVLENNFSAYGSKETTDDARQAVYDVFVNGVRRFSDAKILQFRSFTNYSDGNGNMDQKKCAALLEKYEYLGKDARDNSWGHLYFGHKVASTKMYTVQAGSFSNKSNAEKLFRKIKKAGFDVVVKKVDGEYKVQCGVFQYEKNAKSLVDALKEKGFTAILKTTDTTETAEESVHIILQQCQKFQKRLEEDLANGIRWEYHNPSKYLEEQWELALKNKKYASNCAHLARLAMKEAGLIPQDTGIFYGKLGGSISWGKGTKAAVQKTCTLISIQTKTVKQLINEGKLQPGDIVTYVSLQHTNIYAGKNKWYDAGHAYCSGSGEGAKYNSWYGDGKYDNQLVGWIIRKK